MDINNIGEIYLLDDWRGRCRGRHPRQRGTCAGRWIDNLFIERLWRSVKYEEVYLHAYVDGREAQRQLSRYFAFYNDRRLHQAPDEVYFATSSDSFAVAA